ncbi:MAG: LacI family transcriptional regulator [Firmicutes bacterium]|nr:LacI family transcriptional regulator [Bacillota bacterium]
MKPTMQDVADLAQVSRATVSRVLGDSANVSPHKRALVLEAVQKLGYEPHKKIRTSPDILMCVSSGYEKDSFYSRIIDGVRLGIRSNRAKLIIEQPKKSLNGYSFSIAQSVQGVIILGNIELSDSEYTRLQKQQIPVVVINGAAELDNFSYVVIEERKTMIQVIQELVNLGHQNIAFIHGPKHDLVHQERLRFYKLGLLCSDLSVNTELIVFAAGKCKSSGYQAAKQLLRTTSPTAVIAANDQLALGVYDALYELGFKVPEDISVVGFGDLEIAQRAEPPLSTISVPLLSMGMWAVSILCAFIRHQKISSIRLSVPTSYVRRQSVSKA